MTNLTATVRVNYKAAPGQPKTVRRSIRDITRVGEYHGAPAYYRLPGSGIQPPAQIEIIFDGFVKWQGLLRPVRGYSRDDTPEGVTIWRLRAM